MNICVFVYTHRLLILSSVIHIYMYLGLATWDQMTHWIFIPGENMIFPFSEVTDCFN